MEHRYGPRIVANIKALIYQRGLPVAVGQLRNVGRHGMFLASDYDDVAINQPLEIELLTRGTTSAGPDQRYKTFVVHKVRGGLGLAIREECAATDHALKNLVVNRHSWEEAASLDAPNTQREILQSA
jgi:hypothetical protein